MEKNGRKSLIQAILGPRRDSIKETEVCKALRSMPESQRYNELLYYMKNIDDIIDYNKCRMILSLVNRSLETKKFLISFFHFGLNYADASTIQFWIKWITPKIGLANIIIEMIKAFPENPGGVEAAHYWIRQKYLKIFYSKRAEKKLCELEQLLDQGG